MCSALYITCTRTGQVDDRRMHTDGDAMLTPAGLRISFAHTGAHFCGALLWDHAPGVDTLPIADGCMFRSGAISSQRTCPAASRDPCQGKYIILFSTSSCTPLTHLRPTQHAQERRRQPLRGAKATSTLQCSPRCLPSMPRGTSVPMTDVQGCRSRVLTDADDIQTPLEGAPGTAPARSGTR